MWVKCPSCGEFYEKDQPFKRLCLQCYLASLDRRERTRVSVSTAEYDEMRRAKEGLDRLRVALRRHMPFMVRACHPDRHGGSDPAATACTQWLLDVRKEVAA